MLKINFIGKYKFFKNISRQEPMKLFQLKQIETPRLIIRPIQLGDEIEISAAINCSLVSLQRWMPWAKDPSFKTTEQFVKNAVKDLSMKNFREFPLAVIHKKDNKIISATGFSEKSEFDIGVYEIGYWIDSNYSGQGYVTEYVAALSRFVFEHLHGIRIQITAHVDNEKSIAVAKRCGFEYEATLKHHRLDCQTRRPADSDLYALINAEKIPPIEMRIETLVEDNQLIPKSDDVINELKAREPIFHRPLHGTTRQDFENMTVVDYWEVGASGQRYNRQDCIDTVVERYRDPDYSKNDIWETSDFECRQLSENCYLLTYTLVQGNEKRLTKRSTIWQRFEDQWKIVYHQGTIVSK